MDWFDYVFFSLIITVIVSFNTGQTEDHVTDTCSPKVVVIEAKSITQHTIEETKTDD